MLIFGLCVFIGCIFCFNSYFCGRIIKRFQPLTNNSICFSLGGFTWLAYLLFMLFPLFLINKIDYNFIIYYLFVLQIFLVVVYIINWRYSLMLNRFDITKLLFTSIMMLTIFVVLVSFNNYKQTITPLVDNWKTPFFEFDNNSSNSIFTKISYLLMMLFNINDGSKLQYLWMFPFAILLANTIYGIYQDKISAYSQSLNGLLKCILSIIGIVLVISVFSLCIEPNTGLGTSWMILGLLLVYYLNDKAAKVVGTNYYGYFLMIVNLGIFFLSPISVLGFVLVNIYFIYSNCKNRINNLMETNVISLFVSSFILGLYLFYYANIVGYIISCLALGIYLFYLFAKNLPIFKKNRIFLKSKPDSKLNVVFYILCACFLLLIALITFVPNGFYFNSAPWIITTFVNKNLSIDSTPILYYLVNISWWIFIACMFIFVVFFLFWNHKKHQQKFKHFDLAAMNYTTIWNPLATQFWSTHFVSSNLSLLVVINVNVCLFINVIGDALFQQKCKYNWLWINTTLVCGIMSWIGLTLINILG